MCTSRSSPTPGARFGDQSSKASRALRVASLLSLALLAVGCDRAQLGLPRVALEVPSPDGRRAALVRNHPESDPPNQSLWLRGPDGERVELARLSPDQDWCNQIVWSADGSRVAFLVQDARLVVADAAAGKVVFERWLVPDSGAYPPREKVTELRLSLDGSQATFRACGREFGICRELETVAIP